MKSKNFLVKVLVVIVVFLTPLAVLMVSVRLLIMPSFARLAYHLPGFPDDPYGFSLEDRLVWSEPAINYLVNAEEITFLSSLSFENGEPIFNARELSHMEDVKSVVTSMRLALAVIMVLLLIITFISVRSGWKPLLIQAFHRGGWGVIGLIAAILMFVALNFNNLFTWFHQIFFESGTWQFHPSDTLIRLFPMRFWRDAFIFVGLISILMGILVVLLTRDRGIQTSRQ